MDRVKLQKISSDVSQIFKTWFVFLMQCVVQTSTASHRLYETVSTVGMLRFPSKSKLFKKIIVDLMY